MNTSNKIYTTSFPLGGVEEARSLSILDVATRLGLTLKKKGSAVFAKCVWHDDHHPSMSLKTMVGGKDYAHCFACGKGGDVISLVMASEGIGFLEALRWLDRHFPCSHILEENSSDNRTRSSRTAEKETLLRPLRMRDSLVGYHSFKPATSLSDLSLRQGSTDDDTFDYFSLEDAMARKSYCSSFARCMEDVFGTETMKRVVDAYVLGGNRHYGYYDDVLFPNIDKDGRVLDYKVQGYECDPRADRFFHKLEGHTYWLGSVLAQKVNPPKPNTQHPSPKYRHDCLFGEHLLKERPQATVVLVESPKNACVGACKMPQYVWVAAGSKNMLRPDVLRVLHERNVIVIPDEDAYSEWERIISPLGEIADFLLIHTPGVGEKRDIADWILGAEL